MYVCFSRNTKHAEFKMCDVDVETLIIYISNKLKYLKNDAKKQKSAKEVTL